MGRDTTVLSGVTIHDGAVVAARSVIASDVPPYAVIDGIPARIMKYRFPADQIEKLECIGWWDWSIGKLWEHGAWFHNKGQKDGLPGWVCRDLKVVSGVDIPIF